MANLEILYEESGLLGIIPYSFGMDGAGYRFLCEKIMEEAFLYIIVSKDTQMPFYSILDDKIYFSLYTDDSMAAEYCDELAKYKFYTLPAQIAIQDYGEALWKRCRDLGITHLKLNNAAWISIKDIVPAGTYEGILNNETPLQNPTLNAALYTTSQHLVADLATDALIAYTWELIKESTFYAPVRVTKPLYSGERVTADNSEFHFVELQNGTSALCVFTDDVFKMAYAEIFGLTEADLKIVYTTNWPDIKEYLTSNKDVAVVINPGLGDFLLTLESADEMERILLSQAASQPYQSAQEYSTFTEDGLPEPNKY